MRPRIGITTSFENDAQQLDHAYVRAVEASGGLPLIVPMLDAPATREAFADLLDGLVITGGPAVCRGLIGTLPDDISETDPRRVGTDTDLAQHMLAQGKPILGICYGMQLLNALDGGTIYADVQEQVPDTLAHSTKRGATTHPLHIERGTHLHRLLQTDRMDVNTRHIQALATVGPSYRISATAPDDVIEAIEDTRGHYLGVQFHPERLPHQMAPLFAHLVTQTQVAT